MATLTVRNLDEDLVRRLRIRVAEHRRSAEAEHREILRLALVAGSEQEAGRQQAVERLAEFRRRTADRGARVAACRRAPSGSAGREDADADGSGRRRLIVALVVDASVGLK